MDMHDILTKHDQMLDELYEVLNAVGFSVMKYSYPQDMEMPTLVFDISSNDQQEQLATIVFVPIEEMDELKHSTMMQIMTELPFKPTEATLTETLKCIVLLNNYLLAGNFNLKDDTIFFRYSYFLPNDYNLKNISVFETIAFNFAFLEPYTEVLEKVADGVFTAEEALDYLENLPVE